MSAHEHQWKLRVHLDCCHHYSSTYSCECGATRARYDERDFEDPLSMLWALDGCLRCEELVNGAKPEHSDDVMEPA